MSEQKEPTVNQPHESSLEQFVAHCRINYRSLRTNPRYVNAVVALADQLDACRDALASRDVEAANSEQMFGEAISTLAAIDSELGMPGDACNSTQATLTAIRLLHSAHRDDVAKNNRLTALLSESVSTLEAFKRAGWIMNGAWGDQVNDFIARVKRATE